MFTQDLSLCLHENLKDGGAGDQDYQTFLQQTTAILAKLRIEKEQGKQALLNINEQSEDLQHLEELGQHIRNSFSHIVILGTGGSSLNGQAMVNLVNLRRYKPAIHFLDNIDPDSFDCLLNNIELASTAFIVISKSGQTPETMSQTLAVINIMIAHYGDETKIGKHFFVITDAAWNPLRSLAQAIGITTVLDHAKIGGRFSCFSSVGLLPAIIAGLDPRAFRHGAQQIVENCLYAEAGEHAPAAQSAALSIALLKKGYNINVMMPYSDRLSCFASWYRQIWAESLGKQGNGTTPIKAMGTIDQHSQLQLYLDGPKDKWFTIVTMDTNGLGARIDDRANDYPELKYLAGHTLGDVMYAEQEATIASLVKHNCPVRRIIIEQINEESLGGLIMHSILETIITAYMMNVNPYDQPAVEEGKLLTKQSLLFRAARF